MDLSIVIVNWNTRDLLRDCLNSVSDAIEALSVEVLVVDNASKDNSCTMVREEFPNVRLIESKSNLGFAGGNNLALASRRFHNENDVHPGLGGDETSHAYHLVHGNVLAEAVAWLDRHPDVGVLGPRVLNTDGSIQASCSAFPSLRHLAMQTLGLTKLAKWDSYRMTGWDRSSERRVEVISGAAMFVRRAAMEEVGLLDENFFFYGEETDWCRRYAKAGWALVFAPIPEITHFGNGSAAKLNHRRDVLMTEGTTRLHKKHGGYFAALACFVMLTAHNVSRAIFWSIASVVKGSQARERAAHFAKVVWDLPKARPRETRRA